MDVASILALVLKGISVAQQLIEIGQSAAPAFQVITDLVTNARQGQVTDQQLIDTEKALDEMIADFNEPMVKPADVASQTTESDSGLV